MPDVGCVVEAWQPSRSEEFDLTLEQLFTVSSDFIPLSDHREVGRKRQSEETETE